MTEHEDWLDPDIRSLDLTEIEKGGLQVYRNYISAFEDQSLSLFRESVSEYSIDLNALSKLFESVVVEDLRFLPIICCAYAEEMLKNAFRLSIPDGVPGGKESLFGGYGPLSTLSGRIRLAFAFDILSMDLVQQIDRLRKLRNEISHSWEMKSLDELERFVKQKSVYPIEEDLQMRFGQTKKENSNNPHADFRVRLIWLMGRLCYEANFYYQAKKAKISPQRALYEDGGLASLQTIAKLCIKTTSRVRPNLRVPGDQC